MNYSVTVGKSPIFWSELDVQKKLQGIAALKDKKVGLIKTDLSISYSNCFTRMIWAIVKFCACLRKRIYGVDLTQTQNILKQLKAQISTPEMVELFNRALEKFNTIAKNYKLDRLPMPAISTKVEAPISGDALTTNESPVTQETISVRSLITNYLGCWNTTTKKFDKMTFNIEDFKKLLEQNNKTFDLPYDAKKDFGYIEKQDLAAGSKIYVRADLHGDLKSLLENLKTLSEQGLLDTDYKCKPGVYLVFLGDYADRGDNIVQVLEILTRLRLENPQQVTLIRGNHEDIHLNRCFSSDAHFQKVLKQCPALLQSFYMTMPLTVYLGQITESGEREYAQFTHGLFELYVDPNDMLHSENPVARMAVPNRSIMSERIRKIPLDDNVDYTALLNSTTDKLEKKKLKFLIAAKRIRDLMILDMMLGRDPKSGTTYNWADVGDKTNRDGFIKTTLISKDLWSRKWVLSPSDIKAYLRVCVEKHKVKMIFRGHSHEKQHYLINNKIVVSTLPVGMDAAHYSTEYPDQLDTAYILTIAAKVKNWLKSGFTRASGSSINTVTCTYSVHSQTI